MLKILFIGDIIGKIGRETIKKLLPKIKKEESPDLIIANAENIAHGTGVTRDTLVELTVAGVNLFTAGDHAFKNSGQLDVYSDAKFSITRPANFSANAPGQGYKIITLKNINVLIINLIGRVFMAMDYDCPFRAIDEILANIKHGIDRKKISAIIVDIHAEATSEKSAFKHYVDGRVSAVFGTHTHIMTADPQITGLGTAYITDVGMTGFADGIIGIAKENIIKTFLSQIKDKHEIPEEGRSIFNAVLAVIDPRTAKAVKIRPIIKHTEI